MNRPYILLDVIPKLPNDLLTYLGVDIPVQGQRQLSCRGATGTQHASLRENTRATTVETMRRTGAEFDLVRPEFEEEGGGGYAVRRFVGVHAEFEHRGVFRALRVARSKSIGQAIIDIGAS